MGYFAFLVNFPVWIVGYFDFAATNGGIFEYGEAILVMGWWEFGNLVLRRGGDGGCVVSGWW